MNSPQTNANEQISGSQMLILVLSVYVLAALLVETLFKLPSETTQLLGIVDTIVCFVFLWDFFVRLKRARNKLAFLKWGWIDFVSSIPMLDVLRWGRTVRVVRLFRILRAVRSVKVLGTALFAQRAKGAFLSATLMAVLVIIFSCIVVLNCETAENSNIKTASDALWWSAATVTTVGYGDHYPVTTAGRIVGVVLMLVGIGLFGTFTAFVASLFVQQDNKQLEALTQEVKLLREKLESLDRSGNDRTNH
jgi:voltage-gated potassium channel